MTARMSTLPAHGFPLGVRLSRSAGAGTVRSSNFHRAATKSPKAIRIALGSGRLAPENPPLRSQAGTEEQSHRARDCEKAPHGNAQYTYRTRPTRTPDTRPMTLLSSIAPTFCARGNAVEKQRDFAAFAQYCQRDRSAEGPMLESCRARLRCRRFHAAAIPAHAGSSRRQSMTARKMTGRRMGMAMVRVGRGLRGRK
jgi:hypothetical protein